MPSHGDGVWLVQPRESLARFLISLQRLPVASLHQAHGSKLALPDSNIPFLPALFVTTNGLLILSSRFI
jgi:hypothetical protein